MDFGGGKSVWWNDGSHAMLGEDIIFLSPCWEAFEKCTEAPFVDFCILLRRSHDVGRVLSETIDARLQSWQHVGACL